MKQQATFMTLKRAIHGLKIAAAGCAAMVLISCGGGGGEDAGSSPWGGGEEPPAVAADLSLTLSAQSLSNSGGDSIVATVTAVDSNRNTVSDVPVKFIVDASATATIGGDATGADGTQSAVIKIGDNPSNRAITVTVTSGSLTRTAAFQVTGSKIVATVVPSVVTPKSTGNEVQYRLSDVNSNPMAGQEITVSAPGLPSVTSTTGSAGEFTYTYKAPSTPGSLTITATAAGVTDVQNVQVQAPSGSVPPANRTVTSASINASPTVVGVNTATSNNRSEIRALFISTKNAPVKNVRVRFDLNNDPNTIGGSVTTGSALVYSDSNGVATSAYLPGDRSSPTDGVQVRACWDYVDFAVGTCPHSVIVELTVTAEPLAVTIGTDNEIEGGEDGLTYIKKYVVLVVDASGQAMPNVRITPLLDLTGYYKGRYSAGDDGWVLPQYEEDVVAGAIPLYGCANEDVNRNGVLNSGEDLNGTGKLEPRKSDASIRMLSATTGAAGTAILQLEYPENVATWVAYKITVTASGVLGTEGSATFAGVLPAMASDASDLSVGPAFYKSPYGTGPDGNCALIDLPPAPTP